MKHILFLLLCTALVNTSFAQSTETDPAQIKKTKVQTITVMGAPLDQYGKPSTIRSKKEYRKYNTKGYLSQHIVYDKESAITSNASYAYHPSGKIGKQLVKDANGQTTKKQVCKFDDNGNKTSCTGISDDKEYTLSFTYDPSDFLINRKKEFKNGTIDFDCDLSYQGEFLSEEIYKGTPKVVVEYQRDSTGTLIGKNTYANDLLSYSYSYDYDDKGQLSKESKYDANNVLLEEMIYEYVDKGMLKSISKVNRSGYLVMLWKYFYNEKNNIHKINIYEGEKKTPLYQTEYLYKYYN